MKVKKVSDYYESMQAKYPDIPRKDIERILKYGWKQLFMCNNLGADVIINDHNFWSYIGYLKKDSLEYFNYYIKKLILKLRIISRKKKVKWDGYYYFALQNKAYENYCKQKNTRGRPRKIFNYGTVVLYKYLDECKLAEHNKRYIFRVPYISELRYTHFIPEFITDKAEHIITREPMKFKDISIVENEYEVL